MTNLATENIVAGPLREKIDIIVLCSLHVLGLTIGMALGLTAEWILFDGIEGGIISTAVITICSVFFGLILTTRYYCQFTSQVLELFNINLIVAVHLIAIVGGSYYMIAHFAWQNIALGVAMFIICGHGITAGYHRLFTHRSYKTFPWIEKLLLIAAAASVQGNVKQWLYDHHLHHGSDNRPSVVKDPYDIRRGLLYAHFGWLFWKRKLAPDNIILSQSAAWQVKYYGWLMIGFGFGLPGLIAWLLWNDPLGGLMAGGFIRVVLEWHATWCINSVAHKFGTNPFNRPDQSQNSFILCIVLLFLGEMWHNNHHEFPPDYRSGFSWWQFDSTKWLIWTMSKFGLTWDLKKTPRWKIKRALKRAKGQSLSLGC